MLSIYLSQFHLLVMESEKQCESEIGRIRNQREDEKQDGGCKITQNRVTRVPQSLGEGYMHIPAVSKGLIFDTINFVCFRNLKWTWPSSGCN